MDVSQIWNRADIEYIRTNLKTNSAFLYNGIFFFNAHPESDDVMIQYLWTVAEPAGGACAAGLVRSIIASSYEEYPAMISKFILDNSVEDGNLIPAIVIGANILQDKHDNKSLAIIAHEIGHVLHDDILPGHETKLYTDEHLANELLADAFAVTVLGDNVQAVALLSHISKVVTAPEVTLSILPGEANQKDFDTSVEHIQTRLEKVQ